MRIEVLIDVKTILGEGPLWDVEEQRLYFIDSFGCNVFRCTADGREVRAWDVPAKIGSMALRKQGGRRQLTTITAWYLAGARSQPVVLAFEDMHWADRTSLDLLRAFAERGAQAPLLVISTTRPEFRAPWAMRSHHSVISLAPLDRAQVRRMVGEIASQHALSDEV